MQAVILAAGMATRLKPLTDKTPKCLLLLDKRPILYYLIENLKKNQVSDIIVVTGFEEQQIKDYLTKTFPNIHFTFITNKDFDKTNNAYSLLLAKEAIKGDFILLDSDIVFHPDILSCLLRSQKRPILAVKVYQCGEEEIKVKVNEKKQILEISKKVNPKEAWGESIGVEVFDNESRKKLFQILEKRIIQEKRVNEFYEASFEEMIQNNLPFYAEDIGNLEAMEIDFEEDLKKAKQLIKSIGVYGYE